MNTTQADTTTAQAMPAPTATVKVSDNDELDVWVLGEGTPVVLVHGAFFWYFLKPLAEELAKKGGYQAIWYHRRGYNGKPTEPIDIPDQALDTIKILDALGISKAHVAGHSAGGPLTLELALQAPERLLSAVLLDFALFNQVESGEMLYELSEPAIAKAQAGDFAGGAEAFLASIGGTRELIEPALPGSWSAMAKDAPTFFQVDLPALMKHEPHPANVKAIDVPLAYLEVTQRPPFRETGELLQKWLPELAVLNLSTDDHFFPVTATEETAAVIDNWIRSRGTTN